MKRSARFLAFLAASGLVFCTQTSSVYASGRATTLPTMYHRADEEGAMFAVMRNAQTPIPSDKDHYAIGDRMVFGGPFYGSPDLNVKGGKPVATFYGEATVFKGDTFANMLSMVRFDFVFPNGDHITGQGIVDWMGTSVLDAAITGGTGAYEGVRGTVHHRPGSYTLEIKY